MPNWIYVVFIRFLPKFLFMEPPDEDSDIEDSTTISGCLNKFLYFI